MASTDVAADVEALKKDLSSLRGDIKSLKSSIAAEIREAAANASDGLTGVARSAASTVAAAGEKSYTVAARQIEANPLTSVLMAAGIGIIIGSMLRR